MKTNQFFKVITAVAFMLTLNQFSAFGQYWGITGATGTYIPPGQYNALGTDATTPSYLQDIQFYAGGTQFMVLKNTTGNFGIGNLTPAYMLDILASSTTGDGVNISNCQTCSVHNTTAYNIGGNIFLWHAGDPSSYYSGIYAGAIVGGTNHNTLIGYQAGQNLINGTQNTVIGSQAGTDLQGGNSNTIIGFLSDLSITSGSWNTMVGFSCGNANNGDGNSFYGKACGLDNTGGAMNCFYGGHASQANLLGNNSVTMGFYSEGLNSANSNNVVLGYYADYNGGVTYLNDNNVIIGYNANLDGANGGNSEYNVLLGANCGLSASTTSGSGSYDVLLGYQSYIYNNSSSSVAIGNNTEADNSNVVILGNNSQNVGIGMSGLGSSNPPTNNLEISYYHGSLPSPNNAPGGNISTCWPSTGTGESGLQFRDLSTSSTPYTYCSNQGFLTVDNVGNVIYMALPTIGGIGMGYCSGGLAQMTGGSGGYDLYGNNFYFNGNGSGSLSNNCVVIGNILKEHEFARNHIGNS